MKFNKFISIFLLLSTVGVLPVFSMKRQLESSEVLLENDPQEALINVKPERQKIKSVLQMSPDSLQISPDSLQISPDSLQVSPDQLSLDELFLAIKDNRIDLISRFLKSGGNINLRITTRFHLFYGFTALHYAVISGNENVVQILLDAGANVDAVIEFPIHNLHGLTPLLLAAKNGKYGIVKVLLDHGADLHFAINNPACIYNEFSSIHLFAFEKIREMIEKGGVKIKSSAGYIIPTIQYLQHIKQHFKCPPVCYLVALIYIQRLSELNGKNIFTDNISMDFKTFLAIMVLAAKWCIDRPFWNKVYAEVGKVSIEELNKLELRFLHGIKFNLFVSPKDLSNLCSELIKLAKSVL